MTWRGYMLIELAGALAGGLNATQDAKARAAFRELVSYTGAKDHLKMQYRANLTRTAVIIEGEFDDLPGKSVVVDKLTAQFGVARTQVNSAVTFTLLGGAGATYAESLAATHAYLNARVAEWEVPIEGKA